MLQYNNFKNNSNLTHYITTKKGGVSDGPYSSLNLALHVGDDMKKVLENRKNISEKIGIEENRIIYMNQIHGDKIEIIKSFSIDISDSFKYSCDALITKQKNIALVVLVADCVPLIIFDKKEKVLAVVHAGWKGTNLEISKKTVLKMIGEFGCDPKNILVGIGPSISQENYEVGGEVAKNFIKYENNLGVEDFPSLKSLNNKKYLLDLKKINVHQLLDIGVLKKNIEINYKCTKKEDELLFSARRDGLNSGRFGIIGMIN